MWDGMISYTDPYNEQDYLPTLPLIPGNDLSQRRKPSLHGRLTTGFDLSLLLVLINGLIAVAWGIALAVFSTGVVPIYWGLSQYGNKHDGITNVIVTGVATLSTAQLQYTVQIAVKEYAAMLLSEGFTLRKWKWMQGFAEGSIWPPFHWRKHKWAWIVWLLTYGGMAGHSASLVAILQPQPFYKHVLFNDAMPCGVDPSSLTLNSTVDVQPYLDRMAFGIGLQLGNYYDQVGGNSTTSVAGRAYVKDNFGYGAQGGLEDGLQEVLGVEIIAQCSDSKVSTPENATLASLWSTTFPGRALPAVSITNGTGSFIDTFISTSSQAVITSEPTLKLVGNQTAMYAVVNASGAGGILTTDAHGTLVGCTWSATPRLVHVQTVNYTALTLGTSNTTTVPAPVGRAVSSVMSGIAQAIQLDARLDWSPDTDPLTSWTIPSPVPTTAQMLQTLIADGIKAVLTGYTSYWVHVQPHGAQNECTSNNRTVAQHWRFANDHNLGWLAVVLTVGFGCFALGVVWYLRNTPRMKGFDPLLVVDAFKLGLDTTDAKIEGAEQVLRVRDGRVVFQQENQTLNSDGEEYFPLRTREA